MMIDFDAPEHVRRRRLVSEGFTPKRVREMEGELRHICDAIIDQVCEKGSCDFVADIAAPLPDHRDRQHARRGPRGPRRLAALVRRHAQGAGLARPLAARRRRRPPSSSTPATSTRSSRIAGAATAPTTSSASSCHAEIDGDSLDDDSLIHETLLILIGGDETTRHVISGGFEELLAHPDQLAQLAANTEAAMPAAVEEMLRWVSPIKNMARTATRDVELEGATIKAGQELILLYPSANRDAAVFDDADTFDITRSPNPHMAFGFGAHFCLGNQLARLELKVMIERLLARLPDLHLAVDRTALPRREANFISGIESMPIEFTPTSPVGAGPV